MRRFFDLLKTLAALSKNLALTGLSAITAILVSVGVFTTLRSDFVIVEPLRVPDKFDKVGISGEVATQHLIDEVAALNASTTSAKERTRFGDKIVAENLSGNVGLIDVKSIQVAMRELLGRQVVRISGEIIARDNPVENKYSVRLRRTPERALLVKIDAQGSPAEVLKQAAFAVMEVIEPHIMAAISYRRGNIERANELIDVVLNNNDPTDDKYSLNLRSIMLRDEGQLAEALEEANELMKKEPGFWAVWGNAAAIYAAMGDFPQAIKYIDQTIKLAPHIWGPANEKGRILLEFKKYDEALEWFAKARKLDPKRVQPYNLAGRALNERNELKAAEEMYRRGLTVAPESADSGVKQMIRAISLDSRNYEFLISIGAILLQEKQYAEYDEPAANKEPFCRAACT